MNVSLLGRHIRLFAKVAIVNRSNLVLQYKDGSMAADVGGASAPAYLRQNPLAVQLSTPHGDELTSTSRRSTKDILTPSGSADRLATTKDLLRTTTGKSSSTSISSPVVLRSASSASTSTASSVSLKTEAANQVPGGGTCSSHHHESSQQVTTHIFSPRFHHKRSI